jgi:hypothetical protein
MLLLPPPHLSSMKVFPTLPPLPNHPHQLVSKSGFLYKLGMHIPIYKRRFFQLSSMWLYYSISPHDTEPRGCYNIYNATIECDFYNYTDDTKEKDENHDENDNGVEDSNRTYRFALVWKDHDSWHRNKNSTTSSTTTGNTSPSTEQRVELETRSKQDALQWIRTIETAQISVAAQTRIQS